MGTNTVKSAKGIPATRIGLCVSCEEWNYLIIKPCGWWTPSCKFWNPLKGTRDAPYGMLPSCPLLLEHAVLAAANGWRLDNLADYAPVAGCIESDSRISRVVVELRPKRRIGVCRDEGMVVMETAQRRDALIKLSGFINMEMEASGSEERVRFDNMTGSLAGCQ